jgi:hypothetical protein
LLIFFWNNWPSGTNRGQTGSLPNRRLLISRDG